MTFQLGKPSKKLLNKACLLLKNGQPKDALNILSSAVYGAGYDPKFYELYGSVLLESEYELNAGRFLFLSGSRKTEFVPCIQAFINQYHDPDNFRQLHSKFPIRVKTIWKLKSLPENVDIDLQNMGFPPNIQDYFVKMKSKNI